MSQTERGDPKSLSELLAGGNLGSLAREARRRSALTERVRAVLSADESAHLVSAGLNDAGELVIVMDSAAWAARVRYHADSLSSVTDGNAAAGSRIRRRIRVKVSPGAGQPGTS